MPCWPVDRSVELTAVTPLDSWADPAKLSVGTHLRDTYDRQP